MIERLKSLDLQGYKTFASKYHFEFAGSITAVVGPNGSGKSNIVDAIRWVLGEQSYSLLRGKRTEDMIFSGSEYRPRAGMAEATVLFDNSDGWLPIDYSEVSITRRAYRDGQNEYLINGQKVRLKDVGEILAQSGLAERTYTIIGQGLVDAALSLRADERRRLFEEAAGIGLYRSRREEAVRRLENTRRNLDRVQDILAELQPRLRSLERQARRANEFEQVQSDLRLILLDWYGYHWHRAQRELIQAKENSEWQEKLLSEARKEHEGISHLLTTNRDSLQILRSQLSSWHRQLSILHDQRDQTNRELAVADERTRSFLQQLQINEDNQIRIHEELGLIQNRLDQINEDNRLDLERLHNANDQLEASFNSLQFQQTLKDQARQKLAQTEKNNLELLNNKNVLQARLNERLEQLERLRLEKTELSTKLENSFSDLNQMLNSKNELEQKNQNSKELLAQAENELLEHQEKITNVENKRKSLFNDIAQVKAESTRLSTQLSVLNQAEESLIGYPEGTKLLLEAAKSAKLARAKGAISTQIEVPAIYELALEAALGEFIDAVLLPDVQDSIIALDIIQQKGVRAAIVPLDHIKSEQPLEVTPSQNIFGVAADLVTASPDIRPVIDLLLGNTVIVQNRDSAMKFLSEKSGEIKAVTLAGEVFYANGLITSSSVSSEGEKSSSLVRSRMRNEIQTELSKISNNLTRMEIDYKKLERNLSELEDELVVIANRLSALRDADNRANNNFEKAEIEIEKIQRQINWFESRMTQIDQDLETGGKSITEFQDKLSENERQLAEKSDQINEFRQEFNSISIDEYLEDVNHWRTSSAVAQEAVNTINDRLNELTDENDRLKLQLSNSLEHREFLNKSLAEIEEYKENLRKKDKETSSEVDKLMVFIEPAEKKLDELEQAQFEQQKLDDITRQKLSTAEHRFAQARIIYNKKSDELDTLRRRIEDDFGLVEFEYEEEVSGPTPLPLNGMVEKLPLITEITPELEESLQRKRAQLRRMGAINPDAQREYREVKQRFEFMTTQVADLENAQQDINQVIAELDELMRQQFTKTFDAVATEFRSIFTRLFGGGSAKLILTNADDITNAGIDIEARLPGRRTQGLSLLSGGERSLTAAALVFALLKTSPTPFCVLDEVDAMLDESNVGRFRELLKELSKKTQFIIITHNRNTVQAADVIYGVTMGKDTTSQVLSLRLDQVEKVAAEL